MILDNKISPVAMSKYYTFWLASVAEEPRLCLSRRKPLVTGFPSIRLNIPCPSLREHRLRTHKVFTKDQCFYLNYQKFSIKSYVLDVY